MKGFQNNDYALNRYSGTIVYRFVDGIKEVTLADYLAENPGKIEGDFRRWKKLSDDDYLVQDRSEYRQTWKDIPIGSVAETELCPSPSPETIVLDALDEAERQRDRAALGREIWVKLTKIQRRRYWLHHVDGLSTRKIADKEGVAQRTVMDSIELAEKKIKKHLPG